MIPNSSLALNAIDEFGIGYDFGNRSTTIICPTFLATCGLPLTPNTCSTLDFRIKLFGRVDHKNNHEKQKWIEVVRETFVLVLKKILFYSRCILAIKRIVTWTLVETHCAKIREGRNWLFVLLEISILIAYFSPYRTFKETVFN